MKIISISLSDKNKQDIQDVQAYFGLNNTSEVIRTALREALKSAEEEKKLSGEINALLVVFHSHETEKMVSQIKHRHARLIKSQIHSEIKGESCIDLFLLSGDANEIRKMRNAFLKNYKIKKTELVILK